MRHRLALVAQTLWAVVHELASLQITRGCQVWLSWVALGRRTETRLGHPARTGESGNSLVRSKGQGTTVNGPRMQERREAFSTVEENEAVLENARAEMERHNQLFAAGIISREDNERYPREFQVAEAKFEEAQQHHALIDDKPREEDIAAAQAALEMAKAQLAETEARYEKTLIRSPIEGIVLRKHHRSGESVSNSSTVPDPIVTIGDNSVLRVRMDVDETEVVQVSVGQPAYVTADAYRTQKFTGRVIRVGNELGHKNIRTDEPTERVDTKILGTLIQLDPGTQLPDGLRVDAYIKTAPDVAFK
jgi:HlyD family secretion protein